MFASKSVIVLLLLACAHGASIKKQLLLEIITDIDTILSSNELDACNSYVFNVAQLTKEETFCITGEVLHPGMCPSLHGKSKSKIMKIKKNASSLGNNNCDTDKESKIPLKDFLSILRDAAIKNLYEI